MIVAAVDKEPAGARIEAGRQRRQTSRVAYYTMRLTNIDLKALDKRNATTSRRRPPTKELGKLVVVMRNPARVQVWFGDDREYLDPERSKLARHH